MMKTCPVMRNFIIKRQIFCSGVSPPHVLQVYTQPHQCFVWGQFLWSLLYPSLVATISHFVAIPNPCLQRPLNHCNTVTTLQHLCFVLLYVTFHSQQHSLCRNIYALFCNNNDQRYHNKNSIATIENSNSNASFWL